jgi:tetratricopeptide (TPR) repeat protein
MRRRLNLSFLATLLIAAVLAGTGLYFLYRSQSQQHSAFVLAAADTAEQQGELDKAALYLDRYLVLVPGDNSVLGRYALLLTRAARSSAARLRAVAALGRALARLPRDATLRRQRARLSISLHQLDNASADLHYLLDSAPDDGEAEGLLGQCELALGDSAHAVTLFSSGIQHTPNCTDNYVRLAQLLRGAVHKPQQADTVMSDLVAANPDSAEARLARARYLFEFHSAAEARKELERARSLSPDDPEVLCLAGQMAAAAGEFDKARSELQRALQLAPTHATLYAALAMAEHQAQRHADAIACLRQGLAAVPDAERDTLRLTLLDLLIQGHEALAARELLADIRKVWLSPVLDFHEARLLVQQGDWLQASNLLQRVRPQLQQPPQMAMSVHLLLAECCGNLGDMQQQLRELRLATAVRPQSPEPRLALAAALLPRGQIAEAVNEARQAMASPGAPPSGWMTLARALLLHAARSPARERNWTEVSEALDRAARAAPADPEVAILRAEALAAQGEHDRAQKTLLEARDRQPDQVALWVALSEAAQRRQAPEKADSLLEEAERKLGPRLELTLARLRLAVARGPAAARPILAREEARLSTHPPAEQQRLLAELAGAYLQLGETAAAERLWTRLAEQQPSNLGLRLVLFDLALQASKDDVVQHLLEEMRRLEGPDGAWWRLGEAARLVTLAFKGDRTGLDQATRWIAEVAERRPGWPRALVVAAQIDDLRGRPEQALQKYQEAFTLGERQAEVVQRVVQLLYDLQRYQDADAVLRQVEQQSQPAEPLRQLAPLLALHTQDNARALRLARQAAVAQPTDYHAHLWLGLSLWGAGNRSEAEVALRRAVQLAGDVPETRVALLDFLVATDQQSAAETAFQEARAQLTAAKRPLGVAQCCEVIGRLDEAEAGYQAALEAQADSTNVLRLVAAFYLRRGQGPKAEPLLRKLVALERRLPAAEAAWARRNLAVALAGHGDYRDFREALAILDRNRTSDEESHEDLHTRITILALRPCQHRAAIVLLDRLGKRHALTEEEQFLLAQLYEAQQEWTNLDECLESLLARRGTHRVYLAYQARSHLRRKETAAAGPLLARLEEFHPGSWEAVEIKARLLQAQGNGVLAARVLQKFLRSQSGRAEEEGRAWLVASLLEELGQPAAEQVWRDYVAASRRPESVLTLAGYLGRQKRLPEALDICDEAWARCPPETVAATSVALLRDAAPSPALGERVERRLTAALEKAPTSSGLLLALGDFRDWQGRYPESQACYRRILERDPDNVRALNNLAWLLALQQNAAAEALDLMNHAIDVLGPEAQLLDTRGVVYLALGQSGPALADLRAAIALAPTAGAFLHRARAYLLEKDLPAARKALQMARSAGLAPEALHPLERPAYQQLCAELSAK